MAMKTHDGPRVSSVEQPAPPPNSRGFLAGLSALVAGGFGLFATQSTVRADDDDGGYRNGFDDDGWEDEGYSGGYSEPGYYGGYYVPEFYDDYWDEDDWDDWDD